MSGDVDHGRRHFLTVATVVTGGVGAVLAATPFVMSFKPSARARARGAAIQVDISRLEPGAMMTVEWRGKPVWIVSRPPEVLARLVGIEAELRDPASDEPQQPSYARNTHRSARPEIAVLIGVCTHLGCAPLYRPEAGSPDIGADWPGGFYCPCHGSKFDMAGRVWAGVPAPLNLPVPPHRYVTDTLLIIGNDAGAQG